MANSRQSVQAGHKRFTLKAMVPALGMAAVCAFTSGCATTAGQQAAVDHQRAVADFSSCAKPVYPKAELAQGHTGTVTLRFLVAEDGSVRDSQVTKSSGYHALDEEAQVSIAKCHFKPATTAGKPVKEWVPIQYVWTTL
jgi:TonB family protein